MVVWKSTLLLALRREVFTLPFVCGGGGDPPRQTGQPGSLFDRIWFSSVVLCVFKFLILLDYPELCISKRSRFCGVLGGFGNNPELAVLLSC